MTSLVHTLDGLRLLKLQTLNNLIWEILAHSLLME